MSSPSPSPSPPPSLTTPNSMFDKDNLLSDRLNDFQTRYSRFIRCQDDPAYAMQPACNADDSFINVQRSYQSLLSTISDVSNTLATQEMLGTTNQKSKREEKDILHTYASIREQRKKLDEMLERLYSQQNAGPGSSEYQLKQTMYANTLWIILASCLIWYAVVEMK